MPGYKQVIPMNLGPTPLGKFYPHALATRPGALFISDMQDTTTLTDLPAVGASINIPNAAYSVAKNLLPAGTTPDQTAAKFRIWPGTTTAEAVFERTPKGGIHGIIKKSGAGIAATHGAAITIPDPILEYLRVNPNNRFGFSMWAKITRASSAASSGTSQPQTFSIGKTTNKTSDAVAISQNDVLALVYRGGIFPSPGNYEGFGGENTDAVKDFFISFSTKWHGVVPTSLTETAGTINWGAVGGAANSVGTSNLAGSHPSWVLYGFSIEDLTVSGITTATFESTVATEQAKAFGTGGRFAGDTLRDPAVVLP